MPSKGRCPERSRLPEIILPSVNVIPSADNVGSACSTSSAGSPGAAAAPAIEIEEEHRTVQDLDDEFAKLFEHCAAAPVSPMRLVRSSSNPVQASDSLMHSVSTTDSDMDLKRYSVPKTYADHISEVEAGFEDPLGGRRLIRKQFTDSKLTNVMDRVQEKLNNARTLSNDAGSNGPVRLVRAL